MGKHKIDWVIRTGNEKLKSSIKEYKKFLKVMGNNYKYSASAQLNIYCINPNAKACAEFDFWKDKIGRVVKYKEKGIPVYIQEKGRRTLTYIFDVSQTKQVSEKDKFRLWKFETEHREIFQKLSGISEFDKGKEEVVKDFSKDLYLKKYDIDNKEVLRNFIEKSITIAINERLGISENVEFSEDEKEILKDIFDKDYFNKMSNEISNCTKNILTEINREIKKFSLEKPFNVRYIDSRETEVENDDNKEIGNENERDNQRQGILGREWDLYSDSERNAVRGSRGNLQSGDDKQSVRDISAELGNSRRDRQRETGHLGESKASLFGGRESDGIGKLDEQQPIDETLNGNTETNRRVQGERNAKNDGSLGNNRRTEKKRSNGMGRALQQPSLFDERNNSETIHRSINQNEKGALQTPFLNFRIKKENQVEKLTPNQRLENNINAIRVLKNLNENQANEQEKEILSKYVGWGGLADVFDENKKGQWENARNYLKEVLTSEEYNNARESTLTAFYTPKIVIDTMYKGLKNLGFEKGNILEPSCGIGNFIGNLPEEFSNSKAYGVELDSLSGNIAKKLYPESNIQIKGFEKTVFSNNSFDIAIGNVPFGDFKVIDRDYNKNNFMIHDYFFAKSIDKVKSGGIIAFVTSSGTLDKKDASVRKYIGERTEFLGAIRLPNNIFKGIAGTEVTSDIIFLKKRTELKQENQDWYELSKDKNGLTYNKYFVDNPQMVIGKMKEISGRFGKSAVCISDNDNNLEISLDNAIQNIKGSYEKTVVENETILNEIENIERNFSFVKRENEVFFKENDELILKNFSEKDKNRVLKYIDLSKKLRDVIQVQKENCTDEELKQRQAILDKVYNDFAEKFGYLNSKQNAKILGKDSTYPLLASVELLDEEKNFVGKSDIFSKRTIKYSKPIEKVDKPEEALILSISQKGKVDFEYMKKLSNISEKELKKYLKGQIFYDLKKFEYVPQDEYLSGNIREKIELVDKFLNNKEQNIEYSLKLDIGTDELKYQKEKLLEVMPKKIEASEINIRIGATWISSKHIEKFIAETLQTSLWVMDMKVEYSDFTSEWNISNKNRDKSNPLVNMTYGTSRANAFRLIEDALNLKDTKIFDYVTDEDGKKKAILNKKETLLVQQKQDILKQKFKDWIFKNPVRRDELTKIYNEKFNSVRLREFDGSNLTFDGINPEIKLRQHQLNAVARTLYGGNTLLAHVVGAGKTFEMVASCMESKKLGMSSKSLFVVPNHLTEQMGREFMELYPGANILVATKKDFETKNRKKFIGRIATGEYDAVIIGHSQFEKILMSKDYQKKHIQNEIDEIVKNIRKLKEESNQNFTVKQLEATKKRLETRLQKLNDDFKKDNVVTFEELGIDKLYVDEAHSFKNLFIYTKMRNVAGIGQTEALRSSDMFMKCRYMDEITDGKGIVFATGTPVSNSMSELYTMQRYLQYEELKSRGENNFDSWASTFGETVTAIELSPEGNGYQSKTKFSKFYNLPELMTNVKQFADIQTADMLNLPTPEVEYKKVLTKATEHQKKILESFSKRAEAVRNQKVESTEDNMLKITNDGKKLALDQRLINEMLPDEPNSKVNNCVQKIFDIWENSKENRSTQLVFSDMSTPKRDKSFNIYDDMKSKLIEKGIPENEIAFIHDANNEKQKDELFAKVRCGDIRVLFGSTQKMGAGTNVQNKLIALHDLDVPWRPSDLEQRAGRIVRQGNENKKVEIYRYVTENTFDSYLWVRHEVA
ncbi:helicase [Leptotrichia trevisanii]|uniref:Helicase n=2 Tax=Leptotrichia trevisanii TaxID=109328 RepID=A0A510KQV0_9FUSO|nr:helicase-related protein [Leptotrichia trevisanii]BBM52363.1 helicase [Leptotrichia trevisanii]